MLTCRELSDFMADYLSGELALETRQRFEEHLSVCPNCVNYLEQYKTTIVLGRGAFVDADAQVPPDVPDDLIRAILASRERR